ncbi:MAG: translocation/assembly module TamB domain-containing protein [Snowella sp.]|nr:translocation/assembly module TamB domain-containing protein [Snowella sp.]
MLIDPQKSEQPSKNHPVLTENSCSPKSQSWLGRRNLFWGMGGVGLLLLGGSIAYGHYFVQTQIAPLVENRLGDLINRPVKIGAVQAVSFHHIRFGQTEFLPTSNDRDRASLEALEISFNPLQWLVSRKLNLNVTAIQPKAYLEQGKTGNWLLTPIDKIDPSHPIQLDRLNLEKAQLTVRARNPQGNFQNPVSVYLDHAKIQAQNQGQQIGFQLQGNLGKGSQFKLKGSHDLAAIATNLSVQGHNLAINDINNLLTLPIALNQGNLDSNLNIQVRQERLTSLQGIANLRGVTTNLAVLPQPLRNIQGILRFKGTKIGFDGIKADLGAIATETGGYVDFQKNYNLTVNTKPIAIAKVIQTFALPKPQIALNGNIESKIRIKGALSHPQITASIQNAGKNLIQIDKFNLKSIKTDLILNDTSITVSQIKAIPQQGGNVTGQGLITGKVQPTGKVALKDFQFNLQGSQLPIKAIAPDYQANLPTFAVSGQTKISGQWGQAQSVKAIANLAIPIANGTVRTQDLTYQSGNWRGEVQVSGVNLASLSLPIQPRFRQGSLSGDFTVQGKNHDLSQLQILGQATLASAGGIIRAKQFSLIQKQWQANVITDHLNLRRILPRFASANITGQARLTGSLLKPLDQLQGKGQITVHLPQGKIRATQVSFDSQHFQAILSPESVALNSFSSNLRGNLDGKIKIQGNLTRWQPHNLQAKGSINLSQGLPLLERPLTTRFQWQDDRLILEQVTAKNLTAQGVAIASLDSLLDADLSANLIQAVDLEVKVKNLAIARLFQAVSPQKITQTGKVDFDGKIQGSLQNPDIQGNLALRNLAINQIAFDPYLQGKIDKTATKGLNVELLGENDQFNLSLDPQFKPVSFNFQRKKMQVTGDRQQNLLFVTAQQVPLTLIKDVAIRSSFLTASSDPVKNLTKLTGDLSGNFRINLADSSILGVKVVIDKPRYGTLSGDRLLGNLDYNRGVLTVSNSQLSLKNQNYPFQGKVSFNGQNPRFQGEIALPKSNIEEILQTLQIFRLDDLKRGLNLPVYNKAADLYDKTNPTQTLAEVGLSQSSIHTQLSYLSEINAQLKQQRQQRAENSPIPDLDSLRGQVAGKIAVQGEMGGKIETAFNFTGKDWRWANLQIDNLQLQGNWQNGILTLEPLRLETGKSLFVLTGKVGEESQIGELQLANIPLKPLTSLITNPQGLELDGLLNATISLAGNRSNPQAKGNLQIENVTLNQTQLQATAGNFAYQEGRFDFAINSILQQKTEPLILEGSIPYVFPFASVQPDSDRFNLSFKAKNEALRLIALATKGELRWINGKGLVQLDVFGRIDPQTQILRGIQGEGNVSLENATIAAQVLPNAPLTQVNGNLHLDLNQLDVSWTGQLDGGNVAIAGSLPLFKPLTQTNPLTITFENSAFKLKELYQGGIKGNIQITGSVVEPDISGNLDLFKGKILLGEALPTSENTGELNHTAEFKGLNLNLGEDIRIQRSPVLDFLATGTVTLNGNTGQLLPEGTISLKSGQINLFASQLRLGGGNENVAQFSPHRGLDPYLNLRLVSAATETRRNSLNASPLSSEINEPFSANSESLQMIRIQALVQGYASQLTKSIQLSSSPRRSQREIIALLGGGFVNTLGQEDSAIGLANLAGSAVLGGVQGQIGEALGLSQFRIFPTPLINDQERTTSNQLGVAAEAGVDLSNDLSFSIQKIVNTDRPPQWGLRYRLNENTTIRGSSNFADDSRGIVEYEQRF